MEVLVPRVAGGCFPDPSAVIFGSLSPGEKSAQIIDLYDNGTANRKVEKVYVTHPERFSASLLLLTEEDRQRVHPTAGKVFARIQVTPRTERPGHIDGELKVSLSDEPYVERIPVSGEIVGAAECRPATLVLPRRVENRTVRSSQVLILNRNEKPIEVAVDFVPPSLITDLQPVLGHPDQRLLQVEWRPAEKSKRQPLSEERIRLRIRCAAVLSVISLYSAISDHFWK